MQNGRKKDGEPSAEEICEEAGREGGESELPPLPWEDPEKIYLPDPPPALATDRIADPAAYIAENFDTNWAVWRFRPGSHASKRSLMLSVAVCFLLAGMVMLSLGALVSLLWRLIMGAGVLAAGCVFLFWRYRRNLYSAKVAEFRLVRPVAVKKGCGEKGDEAYRYYRRRTSGSEEGLAALIVYYELDGEPREAETEALYTRGQLDRLAQAFLKGGLVVACRKSNFWGDRAVICSPDLLQADAKK